MAKTSNLAGVIAIAALRITAKTPSYFSAGLQPAFTHTPREVPLAELSEAQVAELKADPWLIVQECTLSPSAEPEAAEKPAG